MLPLFPAMCCQIPTSRFYPFAQFMLGLALVSVLLASGCRNLKVNDKPTTGIVLPKSQMESDSVAVRVAVAEFDDLQKRQLNSFIGTTDQKLPLKTRQRLDENGLRVSVISNVNSARLQNLLAPRVLEHEWLSDQERELAEAGKLDPIHRLTSQRHVQKRRGESFSMQVSPLRKKLTWSVFDGANAMSGQAALAQCQMNITSWLQADGSVKMKFLPEIHHGQKVSKIGVDGQNFAVRQQREVEPLHSLAFELSVRPGETILVAPTEKLERIGKLFFDASMSDTAGVVNHSNMGADPSLLAIDSADEINEDLFPILKDEPSMDAAVLVELDKLDDDEPKKSGRPAPWQRMLLVRVTEVTAPVIR